MNRLGIWVATRSADALHVVLATLNVARARDLNILSSVFLLNFFHSPCGLGVFRPPWSGPEEKVGCAGFTGTKKFHATEED